MMRFILRFAVLHLLLQGFSTSTCPRVLACDTRTSPLVGGVLEQDYMNGNAITHPTHALSNNNTVHCKHAMKMVQLLIIQLTLEGQHMKHCRYNFTTKIHVDSPHMTWKS